MGEPFYLCMTIESASALAIDAAIVIENHRQTALFTTHLSDTSSILTIIGKNTFKVAVSGINLRNGEYLVSLALFDTRKSSFYEVIHHLPAFEVAGTAITQIPIDSRWGNLYFPLTWHHQCESQ